MRAVRDFEVVADDVVRYLHRTVPLSCWVLTRLDGARQSVAALAGSYAPVHQGMSWPAVEGPCLAMVAGAPRVAHDVAEVGAYRDLPLVADLGLGAYIGAPVVADDEVFGTLCGLDPVAQPSTLAAELPLVELLADNLAAVVRVEERAVLAERDAMVDPLTGLANRRAWDNMLEAEEARCARYGHASYVVSIDLDELKAINDAGGHLAGDTALRVAALAITNGCRAGDIVARLGGDEFAVLATNCGAEEGQALLRRVSEQFAAEELSASVGGASRRDAGGLAAAWAAADAAMYRDKGTATP